MDPRYPAHPGDELHPDSLTPLRPRFEDEVERRLGGAPESRETALVDDDVARLLADGPPGEDVGLDAYALDPSLNDHEAVFSDGSEFLGMPQTTGVRS